MARDMRRAVEILLVQMMLLGCVFGNEEQKQSKELVVAAYSARVATGDVISEKSFGLWLRELKDGSQSEHTYNGVSPTKVRKVPQDFC
jgi:hypothetical protein